jgi:hypothetical protein
MLYANFLAFASDTPEHCFGGNMDCANFRKQNVNTCKDYGACAKKRVPSALLHFSAALPGGASPNASFAASPTAPAIAATTVLPRIRLSC